MSNYWLRKKDEKESREQINSIFAELIADRTRMEIKKQVYDILFGDEVTKEEVCQKPLESIVEKTDAIKSMKYDVMMQKWEVIAETGERIINVVGKSDDWEAATNKRFKDLFPNATESFTLWHNDIVNGTVKTCESFKDGGYFVTWSSID